MKFLSDSSYITIAKLDKGLLYLHNTDTSGKWLHFTQEAIKGGKLPLQYCCNNLERRLEEYNYLCNNGYLTNIDRKYCDAYLKPSDKVRYIPLLPDTEITKISLYGILTDDNDYIYIHLCPESLQLISDYIYPDITTDGRRGKLFTEDGKTYFYLNDRFSRTVYNCEVVSTGEHTLSKEQTDEYCQLYSIYRYDFPEQYTMETHTVRLLDVAVENVSCLEEAKLIKSL